MAGETPPGEASARGAAARAGQEVRDETGRGGRVGRGLAFGTDDNEAVVLAADGSATPVPRGPKEVLADVVWDLVAARLAGHQ